MELKQILTLRNLRAAECSDGSTPGERVDECFTCQHRRNVPGNCHIECVEPDAEMTGDPHGIRKGWFMYPLLFDPVWKTKRCSNFAPATPNAAVSQAISQAVSPAK